jgi:hypothetical protein
VTCGESGMGPHDWPYGCPMLRRRLAAGGNADGSTSSTELPALVEIQTPTDLATESPAGSRPTLNVHLVEIQPHPGLATTHPGWWKTKLAISYAGTSRTLWRWHKAPSEKTPTADEIHACFGKPRLRSCTASALTNEHEDSEASSSLYFVSVARRRA